MLGALALGFREFPLTVPAKEQHKTEHDRCSDDHERPEDRQVDAFHVEHVSGANLESSCPANPGLPCMFQTGLRQDPRTQKAAPKGGFLISLRMTEDLVAGIGFEPMTFRL
jgi:hypothetical protein